MPEDTRIPPGCKLTGTRCRCSTCGESFNSVHAFDAHRVGSFEARHCFTCAELTGNGWRQTAGRFWMTPSNGHQAFAHPRTGGDRHDPATQVRGAA